MNYYLKDNDGGIKLYDTDKARLQTSIKYHPELNDKTIYETEREIIELDSKYVFADEHQEEIEQQKAQKEDEEKDQALEQAIDELGKEMLKAQMCENKEWIAEIKAQYQTLMNGDEE